MSNTANSTKNNTSSIPVVAIGASAGGLEQLKLLLQHMPTDLGTAFVVIQHLDPTHESNLAELLDRAGELPAVTIEDGMPLAANQVHILAPGYRLELDKSRRLQLTASQAHQARPTLIDQFFRSLASVAGPQSVGIILSGSGSDGALGLKAIRSAGGLAMAQEPSQAEFDGMPRAAAKYASPDCMLATTDMITPLCNHLRLGQNESQDSVPPKQDEADTGRDEESATQEADIAAGLNIQDISDEALNSALETLREHDSFDFRNHKTTMLKRRLRRRMALSDITDIQTYLQTLVDDDRERQNLCNDFLISVTDFFREPDSYTTLSQAVIPKLLDQRDVNNPIRVWVPGCATGEEAYSIAMLLEEAIQESSYNYQYIIFATDVDETALSRARAGLYPESIEADLSAERLQNFFDKTDDHYQIKRNLRERVVFAPQSVIGDPPYSRLDLISCCNLLIYLNAETQRHLIQLFHFALNEEGFLFLGGSETISRQVDLFEPVCKNHRIYHRLATTRRYHLHFPGEHNSTYARRDDNGHDKTSKSSGEPQKAEQVARDILLAEHVPATVLVNRNLEILCSYGPTRHYLSLPLGETSLVLLDMVQADYRSHLRAVTHRAFRYGEQNDITARLKGDSDQNLLITARPLQQPEQVRGLALITFEPLSSATTTLSGEADSDLSQQLSEELEATRSELHSTIAALEESNENLKGSNEEIMSMNEELQSTNEELENAHNDLSNLFAGTQVATLFLDRCLCIKRFTPAIRDLMNLISSDIGRPLQDMTPKFHDPNLLDDANQVLENLTPRETEVQAGQRWYQRRILPYRTNDDVIKGVVINFADITELKQSMQATQESEQRLDLAISALTGGSWEMSLDPKAPEQLPDDIFLSVQLKNLLGFSDEQMPSSLQAWIERIMPADRRDFQDVPHRQDASHGPLHYRIRHRDDSIRWFASYGRIITDDRNRPIRWLGIDCDITAYKQAEIRARHIQTQLRLLTDALPEMLVFLDPQHNIRFANATFNQWLDSSSETILGRNLAAVLGQKLFDRLTPCIDTALTGQTVSCGVILDDAELGQCRFQAHYIPHIDDGEVLGYCLVLIRNSQADSPIDDENEQAKLAYIQRMATIGEMASTLAHDLRQPLGAINSYASGLMRMLNNDKPADQTTPIVRKIANQVQRADEIVDNVRGFVSRQADGHEPVNPNKLLQKVLSLSGGRARKMGVDMRSTEYTPQPEVEGNPVQLQQVLINLINNAMEAMQDNEAESRVLWLTIEAPKAGCIQVVVEDNGPGIPPEKIESVFDSSHTSKLDGMGMGLAISRTIVEWHGGHLWAEALPGRGARFCLRLPVITDQPDNTEVE